jgi:hypothetical protein
LCDNLLTEDRGNPCSLPKALAVAHIRPMRERKR